LTRLRPPQAGRRTSRVGTPCYLAPELVRPRPPARATRASRATHCAQISSAPGAHPAPDLFGRRSTPMSTRNLWTCGARGAAAPPPAPRAPKQSERALCKPCTKICETRFTKTRLTKRALQNAPHKTRSTKRASQNALSKTRFTKRALQNALHKTRFPNPRAGASRWSCSRSSSSGSARGCWRHRRAPDRPESPPTGPTARAAAPATAVRCGAPAAAPRRSALLISFSYFISFHHFIIIESTQRFRCKSVQRTPPPNAARAPDRDA
jgi:hypothetical protein